MDFEEQLHRTEDLPAPSLTGSSVRSADDSPHNNYIHPEKYASLRDPVRSAKADYKSKLSSSITASLDDLINEGALMGSEEDFDRFLDSEGHVKNDAVYDDDTLEPDVKPSGSAQQKKLPLVLASPADATEAKEEVVEEKGCDLQSSAQSSSGSLETPANPSNGPEEPESALYSTPNLSEYQLSHNLSSQLELVTSLQSHDYHELPTSDCHQAVPASGSGCGTPRGVRNTNPLFERSHSRSQSRSAVPGRRPAHLARGDNYKSTHPEDPQDYELPAKLENMKLSHPIAESGIASGEDADEDRGRQSRMSKPKMGDKVARAEAGHAPEPVMLLPMLREPSLLTSGDYCNFNADTPAHDFKADERIYSTRSASSANYLRSISRSRSRVRHVDTEKNDASCKELTEDGALVNEDPFEKIANLDVMVDQVLHPVKTKRSPSCLAREVSADEVADNILEETLPEEKLDVSPDAAPSDEVANPVTKGADPVGKTNETVVETKANEPVTEEPETAAEKIDPDLESSKADAKDVQVPTIAVVKAPESEKDVDAESTDSKEPEIDTEGSKKIDLPQQNDSIEEGMDADGSKVPEQATPDPIVESAGAGEHIKADETADETEDGAATSDETETAASAQVVADAESPESSISAEENTKAELALQSESSEKPPVEVATDLAEKANTTASKLAATEDSDEEYNVSPEEIRKHLMAEPVYIYTSLAGGMHITQKTNRLTTILTANEVKFTYRDLGTDPEAKRIWQRQANGRQLPGVVRGDDVIGNYAEIDEANEEGRVESLLYETM